MDNVLKLHFHHEDVVAAWAVRTAAAAARSRPRQAARPRGGGRLVGASPPRPPACRLLWSREWVSAAVAAVARTPRQVGQDGRRGGVGGGGGVYIVTRPECLPPRGPPPPPLPRRRRERRRAAGAAAVVSRAAADVGGWATPVAGAARRSSTVPTARRCHHSPPSAAPRFHLSWLSPLPSPRPRRAAPPPLCHCGGSVVLVVTHSAVAPAPPTFATAVPSSSCHPVRCCPVLVVAPPSPLRLLPLDAAVPPALS